MNLNLNLRNALLVWCLCLCYSHKHKDSTKVNCFGRKMEQKPRYQYAASIFYLFMSYSFIYALSLSHKNLLGSLVKKSTHKCFVLKP